MIEFAWTMIVVLGVASLAGAFIPRYQSLGIHGVFFAGYLAVALMATIPWYINLICGVLWGASVLDTTRQIIGDRFSFSRWMATGVALNTLIFVGALIFMMATAPPVPTSQQMALPLPGGGIEKVAVIGSLKAEDTTQDERLAYYKSIQDEWCKGGVRYFANEAEPGTNQNGPTLQVDTVEAAKYRVDIKKVCDPLALAEMVHGIKYGHHLVQAQVEAEAKSYLADPAKRTAAVQFVDSQIAEYRIVDARGRQYKSLGMIPGKNGEMPTLTQFANHPDLGYALVTVLKDGTVRYWRIICDIQLSSPEEIVGVRKPERAEVPPNTEKYPPTVVTTPPSTTKTTPSTETTTSSTTTTTPGTSTTTTPGTSTSTTTTTPPSSTTTTTGSTTSTTTTTTTSPPSSTTTTSPKGTVTVPTGLPTGTTTGVTETTAPVEPTPQHPGTQPGNADPGQTDPGATQEPTQQPVPTVLPTGVPTETEAPATTIPNPDGIELSTAQTSSMSVSPLAIMAGLLLIGFGRLIRRNKEKAEIG